ncbi:MAG: urease accessory protein UreD [Pseudomonadota bacterium]
MFDAPPSTTLQRTRGRAHVALGPGGQLERLGQQGSAKAFLPRTHGDLPEVVFLNTAGGLTGGDKMEFVLSVGGGAGAIGTTQTAERAYKSPGGHARLDVQLRVDAAGRLDWLPQETILFNGSGLRRETHAELCRGATLLMAETVVLGRGAMGETVSALEFTDRRVVTRAGVPLMIEPLSLDDVALARPGRAGLDGARALTTLVFLSQGAEDALGPVRALCEAASFRAFATAWDGKLIVRAMALDPWPLRRWLAGVLEQVRGGPLPRVWQV